MSFAQNQLGFKVLQIKIRIWELVLFLWEVIFIYNFFLMHIRVYFLHLA